MLFALIAHDKPGALADRVAARPDHIAFLKSLGDALKLAGPLLDQAGDMNGSILLVEAETQAEAEAMLSTDPYVQRGIFADHTVQAWRLAINNMGA